MQKIKVVLRFDTDGGVPRLFRGREKLRKVAVPDNVTRIGNSAFRYCALLESVAVCDGILSLGTYCFYYCAKPTACNVLADADIGNNAFNGHPLA